MEQWKSILTKFLKHFFLEYEHDTADDYLDWTEVTSDQTKTKYGGYCSITGMPLVYGQNVSFKDALWEFKRSLTAEEAESILISSSSGEYADAEEHDKEKNWRGITIKRK
jgi:hypothetical protein